jgi:hypothetical protein
VTRTIPGSRFLGEYAKHFMLNLGQALQGIRYLSSHPDIDEVAPRRTLRHAALSMHLRSKRIANDLFFAVIPPHWHHTREELAAMTAIPASRWFQYGYCAWRFTDSGAPKDTLPPDIDKRWDPRCKAPLP